MICTDPVWCPAHAGITVPCQAHLDETLSTCRFAQRMMRVQNTPAANVHQDPQLLIKKYEREIRQLKQELTMHDTLTGRSRIVYDDYNDDQRSALRTEVEEYLEGKKEDIELVNLRQMREILGVTRHIFRDMKTKVCRVHIVAFGVHSQFGRVRASWLADAHHPHQCVTWIMDHEAWQGTGSEDHAMSRAMPAGGR